MTKTAAADTLLKTVIFILLHTVFRLLSINGHDINKSAAEIPFHRLK
jgi:hypothetical protein